MKTDYLVIVGLYFLGMIIRAIYEELKKTGRVSPMAEIRRKGVGIQVRKNLSGISKSHVVLNHALSPLKGL